MTVLSRRAVGACLVAGPALWLSTSVFDRVGTGAGTRVAFFSSWPELGGLTVLVLLTALGVNFDAAVASTALVRVTTFWFAVGIGVCLLPVAIRAASRSGEIRLAAQPRGSP